MVKDTEIKNTQIVRATLKKNHLCRNEMAKSSISTHLGCLLILRRDRPDFERLTRPERGSAREGGRQRPDRSSARSPLKRSVLKTVTQQHAQLRLEPNRFRQTDSPKNTNMGIPYFKKMQKVE